MQNGTIAGPMETWTNPYDECTTCHCFNNTVTCSRDESCVTTPAPTPANPVTHPECEWTYWINVDTPLSGNFGRKYKIQRFKDWLLAGINIEIKPNHHAIELFSYFAYETVAQIVDMALLVKQDKKSLYGDPLTKEAPNVCINYYHQYPPGYVEQ